MHSPVIAAAARALLSFSACCAPETVEEWEGAPSEEESVRGSRLEIVAGIEPPVYTLFAVRAPRPRLWRLLTKPRPAIITSP